MHAYSNRQLPIDRHSTGNMVAENKQILKPSAYPPEGHTSMEDSVAVKAWLDSFGGAIAEADYSAAFIEAGYDSLDNMIFDADLLQGIYASRSMVHQDGSA